MKDSNFRSVVIIGGAGRMGSLFARLLKPYYQVSIFDTNLEKSKALAKELNINYYLSLKEAILENEVIEIATPLEVTEKVIQEISKLKCKDSLIFDIASFKSEIIPAYSLLDKSNKISSIHPMFGPGIKNTKNKSILIVPVKNHEKDVEFVKEFLSKLDFDFIQVDAETHDKIMSLFISLPYLTSIAYLKTVKKYKKYFKLGGASFKLALLLANLILNDSEEQIATICSKKISKNALNLLIRELDKIKNIDKKILVNEIKKIKDEFYKEDNYKKAYQFLESLNL